MVLSKTFPPVRPLWPWGSVAYLSILPADRSPNGHVCMEALEFVVKEVVPREGGYTVLAGASGGIVFDVDEKGEANDCVPWSAHLEWMRVKRGPFSGRVIIPATLGPKTLRESAWTAVGVLVVRCRRVMRRLPGLVRR